MMRLMTVAVTLTLSLGVLAHAGDNPIPGDFNKALEKAATVELYSLDPNTPLAKGEAGFHDRKVLGKTEVKKAALTKLVGAFRKGVAEADQEVSAGCFRPRHGIRVKHDGKSYDFVICFECVTVMIYGGNAKKYAGFNVSRSPKEAFNSVLRHAKIKLPKQAEDD